jgi:hypothetical protein
LQLVGSFDRTLNLIAASERAVMNVGQLNNAKAVEFPRQAPQKNLMMFYRQPKRLAQRRTRGLS